MYFETLKPGILRVLPARCWLVLTSKLGGKGWNRSRAMATFLVLSISLGWASAQEERCISSQFRKPGDYLLGGLFPLRVLTTSAMERTLPDVYTCER